MGGYYSFALAASGWNVTTFEPLPSNLALFDASLCRNPSLRSRIRLNRFALGEHYERCSVVSNEFNEDDGIVVCGKTPIPDHHFLRGSFDLHRLDDVLVEQGIQAVDF